MTKVECAYLKENKCFNIERIRESAGECPKCFLIDKVNTDKVVTVCKLQANARVVNGFWTIC